MADFLDPGTAGGTSWPMCFGCAGTQFKLVHLHGNKGGPSPSVGSSLGQQLPDQICDLARRCDRRDVEAFAVLDPEKEGTQRPRNRRGRPGSFNQHRSGNRISLFRDAAMDCHAMAGLAHPRGVRILTRGGHDWTHRFPAIEQAARALGLATMIIDGEVVILDEKGHSNFGLLQQPLGASGKAAGNRASNAILYAFDLLYLDGHDLRGIEYRSRRHLLEDALKDQDGAIRLSEPIDADPIALLEHARSLGLEGIVSKHVDQPYRSGRTGDWVKLKCVQSEAFSHHGMTRAAALPILGQMAPKI